MSVTQAIGTQSEAPQQQAPQQQPAAPAEKAKGPEVVVKGKDIPKAEPAAPDKAAAKAPVVDEKAQPKTQETKVSEAFAKLAKKEAKATNAMQQAQALANNAAAVLKMFGVDGKSPDEARAIVASRLKDLEAIDKDPFSWLDGKNPNWFRDATNRQLGRQVKPTVEEQIEQAKKEAAEIARKAIEEDRLARSEQERSVAEKQLLDTAAQFVNSNAQKYELICAEGAQDEVGELIRLHYERAGALLSLEEAADHVEAFLVERWRDKVLKTQKAQGWLQPKAEQPAATQARQPATGPQASGEPKTISSQMHAATAGSGARSRDESADWSAFKKRLGV